jgi:hypothetical protein
MNAIDLVRALYLEIYALLALINDSETMDLTFGSVKVHFSPKSGGAAQTLPLCCPASFTRKFFPRRSTPSQ